MSLLYLLFTISWSIRISEGYKFSDYFIARTAHELTDFDDSITKSGLCACKVTFFVNTTAKAMTVIQNSDGTVTCKFNPSDDACEASIQSVASEINIITFCKTPASESGPTTATTTVTADSTTTAVSPATTSTTATSTTTPTTDPQATTVTTAAPAATSTTPTTTTTTTPTTTSTTTTPTTTTTTTTSTTTTTPTTTTTTTPTTTTTTPTTTTTTTTPTTTTTTTTPTTTTTTTTPTTTTTTTTPTTTTTTTTPTTTTTTTTALLRSTLLPPNNYGYYLSKKLFRKGDDMSTACSDTGGEFAILSENSHLDEIKDTCSYPGFWLTISDSSPYKWHDGSDYPSSSPDIDIASGVGNQVAHSYVTDKIYIVKPQHISDAPALCRDKTTGDMFPSSRIIQQKGEILPACEQDGGDPYILTTEQEVLKLQEFYDNGIWLPVERVGTDYVWKNDQSPFPGSFPTSDIAYGASNSDAPCPTIKEDGTELLINKCADYETNEYKPVICQYP